MKKYRWFDPVTGRFGMDDGPGGSASPKARRFDGGVICYTGQAAMGASEDQPVWVIVRSVFSDDGQLVSKGRALAVPWADRESVIYA